jgi:hypothetical protein
MELEPNVDRELSANIARASEGAENIERLEAVAFLKGINLRQVTALDCLEIVEKGEQPAWRATAAQVLGYHGAAVRFAELAPRLALRVDREPDLLVKKSIAFALGGTENVADLLECSDQEVVAEAVLGMLFSTCGWRKMLLKLFSGVDTETEGVMIRRMQQVQDHAISLITFLMEEEFPEAWGDPSPRVFRLFGDLSQSDLFLAIADAEEGISRTYRDIWPGIWRRERKRTVMEIFAERVEKDGASEELMRTVKDVVSLNGEFYIKNRRFILQVVKVLDVEDARRLLDLASEASGELTGEGASRLAEVLAFSSRAYEELRGPVQELVAKWEAIQPGLGLKAFHARLGTGRIL